MSATFDATTTAEYAAATTAAARSAVIVAALTGTISVKVFDGSNVEKGSGTMASPWATASGNTVTIGEVTSFTVGATATPDANWYIRFQNAGATRWLRASFNLTGADFTWSLATWTATHTGTIGTATITTSGNAAPSWTAIGAVAPPSASIAATGGTIQFTAIDPEGSTVTYSLTTTRFGITIDSPTGLVTVTAAAAATSGNIVVEASDGTLTTPTTCAVNVASSVTVITVAATGADYSTIQAAINVAAAGDIIEIQTGTYAENLTISTSGTSTSSITLRARSGDTVLVRPASGVILTFSGASYWTIDAQISEALRFGDLTQWSATGWYGYSHDQTLRIIGNSHHLWFKKCRLTGGNNYDNIEILRQPQHIAFDDCVFSRHGIHWTGTAPAGDGFLADGRRILLRGCTFEWYGGHNQVLIRGAYSVVRGGRWRGDWKTVVPLSSYTGYRMGILNAGDRDHWDDKTIDAQLFGPLLAEDIYFDRAGISGVSEGVGAHKTNSFNLIIRGCLYADSDQPAWGGGQFVESNNDAQTAPSYGRNRYYHNTAYNTDGIWAVDGNAWTAVKAAHNFALTQVKNNIFHLSGDYYGGSECVSWTIGATPVGAEGYANGWKDLVLTGNTFSGSSPSNFEFRLSGSASGVNGTAGSTLTACESTYPLNIYGNSQSSIAAWSNAGSLGNRSLDLQPTTPIAAVALTTVTANSSGQTLAVADASWFYDGANASTWDLGYFGEVGDYIAIGATAAAAATMIRQITAINRTTFTSITLSSDVTAVIGDGVWFAGNANGRNALAMWDNRGVGQ